MALKPPRTITSIVFEKSGKVYSKSEDMPRVQKDLELVIAKKFAGSISRFFGVNLIKIEPCENEADFTAHLGKELIRVQVEEVVDVKGKIIEDRRKIYLKNLLNLRHDAFKGLQGMKVNFVDSGDSPLPDPKKKEGKMCLEEIVTSFDKHINELHTLGFRKIRSRKVNPKSTSVFVSVMFERLSEAQQSLEVIVGWGGGRAFINGDKVSIVEFVRKKVKQYPKQKGEFWLLIYSHDIILTPEDQQINDLATLLKSEDHPFTQVWFIYPYDNQDLGSLIKIYPLDS